MTRRENSKEIDTNEWTRIVLSRIQPHYPVIDFFWKNLKNFTPSKTGIAHIPGFEASPVLYKVEKKGSFYQKERFCAYPFLPAKDLKLLNVKGGIREMLKSIFLDNIEIGKYKIVLTKIKKNNTGLELAFLPKGEENLICFFLYKEEIKSLSKGEVPKRIKSLARGRSLKWEEKK